MRSYCLSGSRLVSEIEVDRPTAPAAVRADPDCDCDLDRGVHELPRTLMSTGAGLAKVVGDQDRWQSNLVDNFERALNTKLQARKREAARESHEAVEIRRRALRSTPGNFAAIRWLGPAVSPL